jgi:hypothetical protein
MPLESGLGRFVAADFGQSRNGAALLATMQGWSAQIRDSRLTRIQAIIQRQRSVAAKRDGHRVVFGAAFRLIQ